MTFEKIRYEVDELKVATIVLDDPDTRNALGNEMLGELIGAFNQARTDERVRCVVLTSSHDKVFSAGGNLAGFAAEMPLVHKHFGTELFPMLFRTIGQLGKPTICAANGHVLAGSLGIALACDLIVASRSAKFGLVEAVVGLTPSMGGTQRLAERAGSGRARELVMTGELFTADELAAWNVVNRVFDDADFEERMRALVEKLAAGPTKAHAMTKHVVRRYVEGGVEAADEAIRADAGELFATEDLQSAVETFLERGPGNAEFHNR